MQSTNGPRVPDVIYTQPQVIDPRPVDRDDSLRELAHWMDSLFEIPGLKLRIGIDSLLGLIPGFGDVASTLVSLYILQAASQRGVSRVTLARMGTNVLIDWAIGTIPIVGDVFDVYWKANERNVRLMREHAVATPATERNLRRSDWLFLGGMAVAFLFFVVTSITLSWLMVSWLSRILFATAQ